ncbi:MAG: hypothetical protein E7645_03420 [Ruminococcaceae bacterium]|nr:hypothetical protein [Oscillospiraceae bacterium]
MLSSKLFNIRLYLEGLKRLKVIGMASAILSVTVSALIPIVFWIDMRPDVDKITNININTLCIPLYGMIFLAPFFFSALFSFLNKRKESDFFHAIPYTRTCVYLSFTAAALSFVFAIMILSSLAAGIIWAMNPLTTFRVGELISVTLMCMLAAAELSGIMILAITLTGTDTTQALMFLLFTLLTRLVLLYISIGIDTHVDVIYTSDLPFLQFNWFLPFGMLAFSVTGGEGDSFNPLMSPSNIIYSLVVTILLFAAGWLLYKLRKSEMAGTTAPNHVTQHIFRILFTLPVALLIPLFIYADGMDFTGLLVFLVISLLMYYLYELITTKRFRGFLKATMLLPVVVVCCLVFYGAFGCVEKAIYNATPDSPDEIASVHLDIRGGAGWDDYQDYLMQDAVSSDPALIKDVIDALNSTVECDRADDYSSYRGFHLRWLRVELNKKDGSTVIRKIALKEENYNYVNTQYVNHSSVSTDTFLSLPPLELIDYYYTEYYSVNGFDVAYKNNYNLPKLYNILSQEYDKLSTEDKMWVRRGYMTDKDIEGSFSLNLSGHLPDTQNYMHILLYVSKELLPETFAFLESTKIDSTDMTDSEIFIP